MEGERERERCPPVAAAELLGHLPGPGQDPLRVLELRPRADASSASGTVPRAAPRRRTAGPPDSQLGFAAKRYTEIPAQPCCSPVATLLQPCCSPVAGEPAAVLLQSCGEPVAARLQPFGEPVAVLLQGARDPIAVVLRCVWDRVSAILRCIQDPTVSFCSVCRSYCILIAVCGTLLQCFFSVWVCDPVAAVLQCVLDSIAVLLRNVCGFNCSRITVFVVFCHTHIAVTRFYSSFIAVCLGSY